MQSARNEIAREIFSHTRCIAKPPFSQLYSLAICFFCVCASVACTSRTQSIQRSRHAFLPNLGTARPPSDDTRLFHAASLHVSAFLAAILIVMSTMLSNTMSIDNLTRVEISRALRIPLRNLLAQFASAILHVNGDNHDQ
jgi:hypothetical protein